MKTQTSNPDKVLTESVIVKLAAEGKIVNKKIPQGLDSFYNFTKIMHNIKHGASQNHCMNSWEITSSIFTESSQFN